jgi:SAM-dependent methyltransferase
MSDASNWMTLLLDGGGPPDIATLWEFGLSEWLGDSDGQRVLDCACGTGFPSIDLARRGYNMSCSDGSPLMLSYFKRRADLEGVPVQAGLVGWEELASSYDTPFDVVMCRGCSLPYAGSWDEDAPPDRRVLAASVRQFAASLRPGGRLYIDTNPVRDSADPEVTTHSPITIGQHTIKLIEELSVDHARRLRSWRCQLTINGTSYEFERRSHYVPPDDLMALLAEASMGDVRRTAVPGEHYPIITATRGRD